jgi:acyl-CoA synthetase (AMP-forming)/AMP-acid ligase II
LIAAPNYHIAALVNLLTSTYSGRRMVLLDDFSPERWLDVARRDAVTHAFVVPTMLHRIVGYLGDRPADLPSLITLAYGGAPSTRQTIEAALRAFPSTGFVNAYGLTETSSTVSVLGPAEHRLALESDDPATRDRLSSVGRPLPQIEVRIAPDGEVLVRGEQVSGEYLTGGGRLDETGWFHTGDAGRFDADGYLYLHGRSDDVIIRGGENISPTEIEEVLRQYPGIRDAAVIGLPDQEWGQRVAAAIEADRLDERGLATWVQARLPSFKRPSRYIRVDALPRNDLGKLLRRVVRQQLLP